MKNADKRVSTKSIKYTTKYKNSTDTFRWSKFFVSAFKTRHKGIIFKQCIDIVKEKHMSEIVFLDDAL